MSKICEWTKNFIDYKNSFQQDVKTISQSDFGFIVDTKTGVIEYVCVEDLCDLKINFVGQRIVCYNVKKNVLWLNSNWDKLVSTNCAFLFVNIDKNEHWTIRPRNHNLIVDRKDLKKGLLVLMESISLYE